MAQQASVKRVRVAAHTDEAGMPAAAQQTLSAARAAAVVAALVQRGVDAARLGAEGYGDTQPFAPGTTEDARALNRRVDFTVEADGAGGGAGAARLRRQSSQAGRLGDAPGRRSSAGAGAGAGAGAV